MLINILLHERLGEKWTSYGEITNVKDDPENVALLVADYCEVTGNNPKAVTELLLARGTIVAESPSSSRAFRLTVTKRLTRSK